MKSGVSESTFSVSSNAMKLLADRRYAFLMAFHPRLGRRAEIRKVTKDVGKLIAKNYLNFASQIVVRNHPIRGNTVKLKCGDTVALMLETYDVRHHNRGGRGGLLLFPTYALDRGLCKWNSVHIETPALRFDAIVVGGDEPKKVLASAFDDHGERFFTWFRSIEQCISEEFAKIFAQITVGSRTYNSAIRQREPYPAYLTTRITTQSSFWNQKREKYHSFNEAKSYFKRGAIVKLIIQNCGVWADDEYCTSQWKLTQVLLVQPAHDPMSTLMFTDLSE